MKNPAREAEGQVREVYSQLQQKINGDKFLVLEHHIPSFEVSLGNHKKNGDDATLPETALIRWHEGGYTAQYIAGHRRTKRRFDGVAYRDKVCTTLQRDFLSKPEEHLYSLETPNLTFQEAQRFMQTMYKRFASD